MMIQSIQSSLVGVFGSCRCYIDGRYGSGSIDELIAQAIEAEKGGNPEAALELISQAGAKIIAGQKFEFNVDMPLGCVAEWADGLDSISATMVSDDSYRRVRRNR